MNTTIVHATKNIGHGFESGLYSVVVRAWDEQLNDWKILYKINNPNPFSLVIEGEVRKDEVL